MAASPRTHAPRPPRDVAEPGLRRILAEVAASPAARLYAAVWLASAAVLALSGQGFPWFGLGMGVVYLGFSLATVRITRDPPTPIPGARPDRPRLWLHVALLLLFAVLTGFGGMAFHRVIAPDASIPLWTPLTDALHRLGGRWFGNDNYVANPVTYVVIPLALLLLAGARLPSLGFGRGHRVGRVLLLWCAVPVAYLAVLVGSGGLSLGRVGARLVSNTMQNGFWEEFLFRGALQTRLRLLWGPGWALVLQALLFGAWHLGLGYGNTGYAGLLPALASVIVHQSLLGLAFGVIFQRTRNLAAPSIVHVVVNTLG